MGQITALENGDAAVQQAVQHVTIPCGASTVSRRVDLTVWRVTALGAATATDLHSFSRTWLGGATGVGDEQITPFVNRPDGHGGILSTCQKVTAAADGNHPYEAYVSRVVQGGGVAFQQPAPWALYWNDRERSDVMITSDATIYVPDGPSGELRARATDTWVSQWTSSTAGEPVQGLDGGGVLALVGNALTEFAPDGTVASANPTGITGALVALRDQEILHGLGSIGAIEAVSLSKALAGTWSFLKNIFSSCVDTKLNAVVFTTQHIGIPPKATPYTYKFVDDPAHPWLTRVGSGGVDEFQKRGVRNGFDEWNDASVAKGLGYQFLEVSSGQADFEIAKVNFQALPPAENRPLGTSGEFKYWGYPALPPQDRRITGGRILIADDMAYVFESIGYRKVTMHELGHALGLAHPWAPLSAPPANVVQQKGGTLMNNMLADPDPSAVYPLRDDAGGRLPNRPTACDIRMVRLASTSGNH